MDVVIINADYLMWYSELNQTGEIIPVIEHSEQFFEFVGDSDLQITNYESLCFGVVTEKFPKLLIRKEDCEIV